MKSFVACITAACLMAATAFTSEAHAGSAGNVRIVSLSVAGAVARVAVSANITSPDACATNTVSFAFSATTNEGKAMLTLLTSAILARKNVTLIGTDGNNCTNFLAGGAPTTVHETLFHVQLFETAAP